MNQATSGQGRTFSRRPRHVVRGAFAGRVRHVLSLAIASVGLLSLTFVAAGIGSSAPAGAASATKSPILIGNMCSCSGVTAAGVAGSVPVLQGWVKDVNAHGGINGHPVKAIYENDALTPSLSQTQAKELVADHVVAIVGNTSEVDSVWAPIVQAAGIPVIGGTTEDTPFMTSPDFFATGPTGVVEDYAVQAIAKAKGTKMGIVYCAEVALCAQDVPVQQAAAKIIGEKIVYTAPVLGSAPSYVANCLALKAAGADSVAQLLDTEPMENFANQCLGQGLHLQVISKSGATTTAWLSSAGLNGVRIVEGSFPYYSDSSTATKTYQAFIHKYVPNLGVLNGASAANQYVAAQAFEAAVKAGGSGTVTAASVKKGLYSFKNQTLDGLSIPLNFKAGQVNLENCWFVDGISEGQFFEPQGLKVSCAPNKAIAAMAKTLGV